MTSITRILHRSIIFAWLIIAGVAMVLATWAIDRSPPFKLLSYSVFNGRPGDSVLMIATVKRDLNKACSVTFSRYLFDHKGVRTDLSGIQYMTASALSQMDKANPNKLLLAIKLPVDIAPGPAKLVTSLEYVCNPIQRIWPLDVLLEMDMEILS